MNRHQMVNQFHFTPKKTYKKKDYVPLIERDDWDGKVEVLKPTTWVVRPPHKA